MAANNAVDAAIEEAIVAVVEDARASDKLDELTINTARHAAEVKLGLESGYLRSHSMWNAKSKDLIKATVNDEHAPSSAKAIKADSPSKSIPAASNNKRRKGGERDVGSLKRRKSSPHERDKDGGHDTRHDSSALSDISSDHAKEADKAKIKAASKKEESESELSDVIDEPLAKKAKPKSKTKESATKKAVRGESASRAKIKDEHLAPDEVEIKRLQGWLLKCGIRKLWHRELAPYDSTKAKIKHLKSMLEDVGLTGRYSAERASAIKERRELAAELEAVQEGNEAWGKSVGSDSDQEGDEAREESPARAVRKRPAASRLIDFGSDDEDD